MGLDLVVESCANPGHEDEWRRFVDRAFAGEELSDAESARFAEISTPGYARLGAPRVGYDKAADDWIVETRGATTPEEIAAALEQFHGYHALRLVKSDGLPEYSNGGNYQGIDETSFRGAFFNACGAVLDKGLIERAWDHKLPEAAVTYGQELLASAAQATARGAPAAETEPPKRGLLARLGLSRKPAESIPFDEQCRIVEAAGRWFVFWGERGHPIRAWF
jgi:hypothetical protein